MKRLHILLGLAALLCLGTDAWAAPGLSMTGYTLASQKRISLTVYEYVYSVAATNSGTDATGVSATLSGVPVGVTVVDGAVAFPDIASGATAQGKDSFTIRQDRSKGALKTTDLQWTFTASDAGLKQLPGAASTPASQVVYNYVNASPTADSTFEMPDGSTVLRTALVIDFETGATAAQVNQAVASAQGHIVGMSAGVPSVVLSIPEPASLTALLNLQALLQSMPGVKYVGLSYQPSANVMPGNPSYQMVPPQRLDGLSHQLVVRGHAAWNAKALYDANGAAGKNPLILIIDEFGDGPPTANLGFDVNYAAGDFASGKTTKWHGYNVLSILASSFGGQDTRTGVATGIFPGKLDLRVVDTVREPDEDKELLQALDIIRDAKAAGRNVIVNRSMGYTYADCKTKIVFDVVGGILISHEERTCPEVTDLDDANIRMLLQDTARWTASLRNGNLLATGGGLESAFLFFNSSGNNGKMAARYNSQFDFGGLSALVPLLDNAGNPLLDTNGNPVGFPGLTNVLSVEARPGTDGAAERPYVGCVDGGISEHFSPGGHLSAIGHMFQATTADGGTGSYRGVYAPFNPPSYYAEGSSLAAPQAAGVAALVWSAHPELSMAQVRGILLQTVANLNSVCVEQGLDNAPRHLPVDAYAAVLAGDDPDGSVDLGRNGDPAKAKARLAVLDVASPSGGVLSDTPDGKFTQADILKFLQEFEKRRAAQYDYSRYDLNGDGHTGETILNTPTFIINTRRVDLNGDLAWNTATQRIGGAGIGIDEVTGTDIDVLIYYAHSPLYTGSEYERDLLLLPYLETFHEGVRPHLRSMQLSLAGLGAPIAGTTNLGNIYWMDGGNSDTFSSQCPGGERGAPLFSQQVTDAAQAASQATGQTMSPRYWWATSWSNVPPNVPTTSGGFGCSDFIATVPGTGKYWLNIVKSVPAKDGTPAREYQTRLYLGDPDLDAQPGSFQPSVKRVTSQQGTFGYVEDGNPDFQMAASGSTFLLQSIGYEATSITYYAPRQ